MEGEIDSRINDPKGNRGSDVLLIFAAKAEDPEKYREQVQIVDTQNTKDLLDMLKNLGTARVVDGTARPVEEPAELPGSIEGQSKDESEG